MIPRTSINTTAIAVERSPIGVALRRANAAARIPSISGRAIRSIDQRARDVED